MAFSSMAGRFGNGGQTDYSAANDLLCKLLSSLRRTRPEVARARDRLDRVGQHRDGDTRIDPEDDGGGRDGHAACRGRGGVDPA